VALLAFGMSPLKPWSFVGPSRHRSPRRPITFAAMLGEVVRWVRAKPKRQSLQQRIRERRLASALAAIDEAEDDSDQGKEGR
jgi:hypothetical protein